MDVPIWRFLKQFKLFLAEVATLQLEFRDLSRVTKKEIYEKVSFRVSEKLHDLPKNDGLVGLFINAQTGTFRIYSTISLGARGDSYYEYLLKVKKKINFFQKNYNTNFLCLSYSNIYKEGN